MRSAAAQRYAASVRDIVSVKAEAVFADGKWKLVIHGPTFVMEAFKAGAWWSGSSCGGGLPESITLSAGQP